MTNEDTSSAAERQAEKLIRRQKRNLRTAHAQGMLQGIASMLTTDDLVLDCGANVGDVTAVLAPSGAQILAFEPDPLAVTRLQQRFKNAPNVSVRNVAVGAKPGEALLMRADNFHQNPDGALVKSTIIPGGRSIDPAHHVAVEVIDFLALIRDLLATRDEIAFVKMDIEGAELDILEAMDAQDLFAQIRVMVVETHERKFKDLRPRFRAIRARIAKRYAPSKVNLDWI